MTVGVLVLRPEPGASRTAAMLEESGLEPIVHPLFAVEPLAWALPQDASFDALLLTSANSVRHAGPGLAGMRSLPCYCVGDATAEAARAAGFSDVRTGGGDAASTIPLLLADGRSRILHPCGEDVRPFDPCGLRIESLTVYRSAERGEAAQLEAVLQTRRPAIALVHSPRAGKRLDGLVSMELRSSVVIVAISEAAAAATGAGWREVTIAASRNDVEMISCAQRVASLSD